MSDASVGFRRDLGLMFYLGFWFCIYLCSGDFGTITLYAFCFNAFCSDQYMLDANM